MKIVRKIKASELRRLVDEAVKKETETKGGQKSFGWGSFNRALNIRISFSILMGVLASIIVYFRFGWVTLEQYLLSWMIGATVMTAILSLFEKIDKHFVNQ